MQYVPEIILRYQQKMSDIPTKTLRHNPCKKNAKYKKNGSKSCVIII